MPDSSLPTLTVFVGCKVPVAVTMTVRSPRRTCSVLYFVTLDLLPIQITTVATTTTMTNTRDSTSYRFSCLLGIWVWFIPRVSAISVFWLIFNFMFLSNHNYLFSTGDRDSHPPPRALYIFTRLVITVPLLWTG